MKTMIGEPPLTAKRPAPRQTNVPQPHASAGESLQIKTILVPLDFSEASMRALKYDIPLAEKFGAAIHLVHVQPTDEMSAIAHAGHFMLDCADSIALMQDRLAEVERGHDLQFWPDNCHVLSGHPAEEICRLAQTLEADLIILPTRGHSGLRHLVLGSTAERIVRHAPCPVLVLRGAKYEARLRQDGSAKFELGKILVPVDFSHCSLGGVRYAARLARSTGATLRLLHVVYPYAQILQIDRMAAEPKSLIETAIEAAREEMLQLQSLPFLRDLTCETEIRIGTAVDMISGESGQPGIDLLVTSTHGRTGFERALLGSVAEHVVRYTECPVITVPTRGQS